jgi:hypothetical protein
MPHGQHFGSAGDGGEWFRPVMTAARVDGRLAVANMDLRAVAVGLDLVIQLPPEGGRPRSAGWHGSMKPG